MSDSTNHKDEFRPRARTMSPSILRKLHPGGTQASHLKIPPHEDSMTTHTTSMLISALSPRTLQQASSHSAGSLPEVNIDQYIHNCLDRASNESLDIHRQGLPRGSRTFQTVMVEMGSQEAVYKPDDDVIPTKIKWKVQKSRDSEEVDGSSRGMCTPENELRHVRWNVE